MTVANQTGSNSPARKRKPLADVVDLLAMSTLDQVSSTLPAEDAGDLLDALVEDHLTRAMPPSGARRGAGTPPAKGNGAAEDRAGILQKEIDALLGKSAETPPVDAAPESAPAIMDDPMEASAPLTADELDILLSSSVAEEKPLTASRDTLAATTDEGDAKLLEAEGVLAEELAQLMADKQIDEPMAAIAPAQPNPNTADSTSSVPIAEAQATDCVAVALPPGVPEHPIVEMLDPARAVDEHAVAVPKNRFTRMFSDMALVAAQIADMPFQWLDVMDKNLLGVAALILLLSGAALKLFAWWMGA